MVKLRLVDQRFVSFKIFFQFGIISLHFCFRSIEIEEKDGLKRHVDSNITFGETSNSSYQLSKEDPLTAKALCKHHLKMKFGNENVETEIFTESEMSADLDNFHLKESLTVQLNDETFFEKSWESSIPRIFV